MSLGLIIASKIFTVFCLKYSEKSRLSCHDPINNIERITMIKSDLSGLSYAKNSACLVCDSSDQGILGHRGNHEDSGADIEEVLEGEGVDVLHKAFDQASLVAGMAQLLALVSGSVHGSALRVNCRETFFAGYGCNWVSEYL